MRARDVGWPALVIAALSAVLMVAVGLTVIVGGIRDLTREPTCGGRTMSSIDGC
ncbi:hypothetical protein GPX89_16545 [Nocardia sp. ET3-3]|uniref:Uncharacterized protein n=1 Tax=Nocardia terrae TaxID=2675851 RepID=A0A7K1UXD5_9NOCA|nr:hypothetical protein [Nocardia terrae]MVU78849.1 hypothetical protein [Nocardia terrae]